MKPLAILLLIISLAILLLVAQSFQEKFFGINYFPSISVPKKENKNVEGSGGAPRKSTIINGTTATSSNAGSFVGPSGPPHIIGPTTPPPGN